MKNVIKNQKLFFISLIGIIVVSSILIYTYAYQSLQVVYKSGSKEKLTVNAGVLDVTFAVTNRLNITSMPLLSSYKSAEYSEFTISNTKSSDDAAYKVSITDMTYTSNLVSSDFNYTLVNADTTEIVSEDNFSNLTGTSIDLTDFITLKKNSSVKLRLYLWLKETNSNQNNLENASFKGKIEITSMFDKEAPKNPFKRGTFAYTIINNAKNATGDKSIYQETPTTSPGNAISTFKYVTANGSGIEKSASTMSVSSTYQAYYWIYGTGYTVNENTGYFTLTGVNSLSTSSKTYANMYSDLVGKYLISNSASSNSVSSTSTANPKTTSNISSIYKVTAATSSQITYKEILSQTVGTEKTLSKSEDDYGDSYYYRGKVIDNYVNFAGMCWRIVRIQGDGSVKLILEDQNTICNSSSYTGNWNIGTATFGHDNSTYGSSKYVINYLNPVSDASSALVNEFKAFQTGTLTTKIKNTYNKELSDYLKVGDWCYDDTAYASNSSTSGTPLTEEQKINYYNRPAGVYFYYDSYIRLVGQSTKTPTNKCNGTILNQYNENTDMYVATITVDEITYAGGKYNSTNYGYYLLNDYQRINTNYWWSLSPRDWYGSLSVSFVVLADGHLGGVAVTSYYGSRPAVSLKSSTSISGGDGTKNNPYTVG